MQLYEYAWPDVMSGKKILYVHGFASSGANGAVDTLRILLPSAEIIAPDLPVEPSEAMQLLHNICEEEKIDLAIGTSMGGMYAEQLYETDRILVNPAFTLADTILKNNGLGRQEYHNPRKDGQTSFLVNKALLESYREVSSKAFSRSEGRLYGLFGIHDTMTDCFDLFASHCKNAIRFDGEHYMNDKAILHSVLPLVRRIDDEQQQRSKKTVFISLEDTLCDVRNGVSKGKDYIDFEPEPSAVKAFAKLSEKYDVYVLESFSYNSPEALQPKLKWVEKYLGVPAWDKVILSNRKDLCLGDYLIDRNAELPQYQNFMGTLISFAKEPFQTWEDILVFFDRLGGQ